MPYAVAQTGGRQKMKVSIAAVALVVMAAGIRGAYADWGLYSADRSWTVFVTNGANNTRAVWNNGFVFGTPHLGTFNPGASQTLTLSAYDVKTWKNSGSDVTGGTYYYRIYATNASPGSFSSQGINWIQELGGGDQKWGFSEASIDLLGSRPNGTYNFEFYAEMNGTAPTKTEYDNNGGSNFTATFTVIPEPASAILAVLAGTVAFTARRRRLA
jgi:hypothetical protein